jgi:hypothetical protein
LECYLLILLSWCILTKGYVGAASGGEKKGIEPTVLSLCGMDLRGVDSVLGLVSSLSKDQTERLKKPTVFPQWPFNGMRSLSFSCRLERVTHELPANIKQHLNNHHIYINTRK